MQFSQQMDSQFAFLLLSADRHHRWLCRRSFDRSIQFVAESVFGINTEVISKVLLMLRGRHILFSVFVISCVLFLAPGSLCDGING